MDFNHEFSCYPCYLLSNKYNSPFKGEIITWRRYICGHCIEKCAQEGWRKGSLPDSFLERRVIIGTNEVCSVCSKSRALLFYSIVCDEHVGHFNENEPSEGEI